MTSTRLASFISMTLIITSFVHAEDVPTDIGAPFAIASIGPVGDADRVEVSPDGNQVFAISDTDPTTTEEDRMIMFVRDPATGALVPVTQQTGDRALGDLAFASDGRTLYSLRRRDQDHDFVDVWDRDSETGALTFRTSVIPEDHYLIDGAVSFSISADDRYLLFGIHNSWPFDGFEGATVLAAIDPETRLPSFDRRAAHELIPRVAGRTSGLLPIGSGSRMLESSYDVGIPGIVPGRPGNLRILALDDNSSSLEVEAGLDLGLSDGMLPFVVSPDGRFAFVLHQRDAPFDQAPRGDRLFVVGVDVDGSALELIETWDDETIPALRVPRTLVIDPSGRRLTVASDNGVVVFSIDGASGRLTPAHVLDNGFFVPRNDVRPHKFLAASPTHSQLYLLNRESQQLAALNLGCTGDDVACLRDEGRFRVEADWRTPDGRHGRGQLVPGGASDRSGLLYFFRPDNWEMLVKVLDGCAENDRFWVFAAATTNLAYTLRVTDTWSGTTAIYTNPLDSASPAITDTRALSTCAARRPTTIDGTTVVPSSAVTTPLDPVALDPVALDPGVKMTGGACDDTDQALCLLDGRFRAEVEWRDFSDRRGRGRRVPIASDDSGLFSFFNPRNWEMLVKVLDGCAINGHHWIFGAASTNVEYRLTLTDTMTGETRVYDNTLGDASPAIIDTRAFMACP